MDEREDGEISEGTGDSFDVAYKPVLRPDAAQYRCVPRPQGSSDEDYSSDSDLDMTAIKRKRPNVSKMDTCPSESSQQKGWPPDSVEAVRSFAKPKRRNNVWSTVMEEQVLSQEIGGFGLKRRLDQGDRSVESYDYIQARKLRGLKQESDEEGEIVENEDIKKKRMNRKRHVKGRDYVNHAEDDDQQPREVSDVVITDEMTDDDVGIALADALHEYKPDIIVRVVEVLGREKSLALFKDTQEVERNGGLLVLDGSRRRTSGGVFLQLLKKLPGVERADLNKIFIQDVEWRKRKRAHRRRERHESKPQDCDQHTHNGLKRFSFENSRGRNTECGGAEKTHANQNIKLGRMERKKVYTWEDFSRMILEEPNAQGLLPSLPRSPRTTRMIYPLPQSISCHHQ